MYIFLSVFLAVLAAGLIIKYWDAVLDFLEYVWPILLFIVVGCIALIFNWRLILTTGAVAGGLFALLGISFLISYLIDKIKKTKK